MRVLIKLVITCYKKKNKFLMINKVLWRMHRLLVARIRINKLLKATTEYNYVIMTHSIASNNIIQLNNTVKTLFYHLLPDSMGQHFSFRSFIE